jgi:hypothetical protein
LVGPAGLLGGRRRYELTDVVKCLCVGWGVGGVESAHITVVFSPPYRVVHTFKK